jgi:hypothetical protein
MRLSKIRKSNGRRRGPCGCWIGSSFTFGKMLLIAVLKAERATRFLCEPMPKVPEAS